MSAEKENETKSTGHIYDGIEELDHPTPNWFQALFYITIIFGVGYFFHYNLGEGPSLLREYERDQMAENYAIYEHQSKVGAPKELSEEELTAFLKDVEKQKTGQAVFQAKCASCHGAQGQGGIGPNLTDDYWLHGNKMTQVLATISKGVPDKGMPPWGAMMSAAEIQDVTVFIRKIAGSRPAGAKAPQGELIK